MIDKFFKQTNKTIWDFLQEIGKDKEVFSAFSCNEIDWLSVYFYATKTEIVLVCLDCVEEGTAEYADKGLYYNGHKENTYKYFRKALPDGKVSKNKEDWRFSPVAQIYEHACRMREFYAISRQFDLVPAIHLMFITSSRIVNYSKVVNTWQQNLFGFSFLQKIAGISSLNYYDMPTNYDLSLESSAYWTKWQKYLKNRGWFDWLDYRYDDWPLPNEKRYTFKQQMGHLISDEFEEEK